jgi:hypothetical protein
MPSPLEISGGGIRQTRGDDALYGSAFTVTARSLHLNWSFGFT